MPKVTYEEKKLIILKESHLNKQPWIELNEDRLSFYDISVKHLSKAATNSFMKQVENGYSVVIRIDGKTKILQYNC